MVTSVTDCSNVAAQFWRPCFDRHRRDYLPTNMFASCAKDHPLAGRGLTLEAFTASSHVLAKPSGIGSDTIDYWLALHNLNRHISLVVAYFADAMRISAVSDLLSCVPVRRLNESTMTELGLVARPLPFETEKILFKMVWHERTERSASHSWLRDLIVAKLALSAGEPRDP